MSTFSTLEGSVEESRPYELFELRLGSTSYRYVTVEEQVTVNSLDWDPLVIQHSALSVSPEARLQPITVILPADNPFVQQYLVGPPGARATLQIWKVQRADPTLTPFLMFKGVVRNVNWVRSTQEAQLSVVSVEAGMGKPGPRLGFGAQCPLMLYGQNCKAVRASFLFSGTVGTVTGGQLTVPGLDAAKGVGWAALGEIVVSSTGDRRMIKAHAATDLLTLNFPFDVSPLALAVEVVAGCDHTPTTCDTKFSNIINYGGWPYIPGKNIFTSGIL